GLSLRVSGAAGGREARRSWTLHYRHAGKQRRLTLGHYPALTLAAARDAATEAHRLLAAGIDPAEAKAVKRQPDTVERVAELYVARALEAKGRSARHVAETRRIFAKYVLPAW